MPSAQFMIPLWAMLIELAQDLQVSGKQRSLEWAEVVHGGHGFGQQLNQVVRRACQKALEAAEVAVRLPQRPFGSHSNRY